MDIIKLDIGAGVEPRGDGYTPIDKYVNRPGYVVTDMWDLSMYADGSVSAIWCSHALEHIEKKQVLPTLKEWFRVLRPCGLLQIEVPDLAWVLQNWLENQDNGWNLDAIFGSQETPGQQHKTGFTPLLLEAYLKDAGFINDVYIDFVFNHNQQSIRAEVLK